MAKKRNKITKKEEASLQEGAININDLSISELARQLEKGQIEPKVLDKALLEKCAMLFYSRGYKSEDIAEILKVCSRTVERYLENVREDNCLEVGAHFQQKFLGEALNSIKSYRQRLLRLSYSYELSDYEKARTIFMCLQVDMNGISILRDLGYLSKAQGAEDIQLAKEEEEKNKNKMSEWVKKQIATLSTKQKNMVMASMKLMLNDASNKVEEMIKDLLAKNAKRQVGISSLVMRVTVVAK